MNRGQLWAGWRKSFLTVVNALIMCMGATIVGNPCPFFVLFLLTHEG